MNKNTDSYLLLTSLRVCLVTVGERVSSFTRGSTTKVLRLYMACNTGVLCG